jgi:hypothetical protein
MLVDGCPLSSVGSDMEPVRLLRDPRCVKPIRAPRRRRSCRRSIAPGHMREGYTAAWHAREGYTAAWHARIEASAR